MNELFRALLWVHIFAGTVALVVAPAAMVTFKGGRWHRRWGMTYLWATVAIAATGTVMSFLHPNLFLLMIAVFSFYLVFSGYRVLQRKKPGQHATFLDRAVTLLMIAAGVAFIGYGMHRLQSSSFGVVPIVFGAIALLLAGAEMVQSRRPPTDPRWWWFSHMRNMLAAYITTVSAFSVVNLTFLPASDALALADDCGLSGNRPMDEILPPTICASCGSAVVSFLGNSWGGHCSA